MTAEDYFARVARGVFVPPLSAMGANEVHCSPLLLRFESLSWFVELVALADDGPNYRPRIEIGPLPFQGAQRKDRQVDIVCTVPPDSPLEYFDREWRYTNPLEMEHVFEKVLYEVFLPFAVPYLKETRRLADLVSEQSSRLSKEWKEEIDAHNDAVYRQKAQEALTAKDIAGFIRAISNIPPTRQTTVEHSKIRYWEKKLR